MSSHDFPADLYPDLLSRLPAKTLLKFKFVSKLWLSIIKDPKFSSMHANRLLDSSSTTQIYLHTYWGNNQRINKISDINFSCGVDGVDVVRKEFSLVPDGIQGWYLKIVGSSNGVLCLVYKDETSQTEIVNLWNPLSKNYRRLPPVPHDRPFNLTHGFGYDKVNNDYKVVCFLPSIRTAISRRAMIYSRNLNTWRTISLDKFPITWYMEDSGVLFGGSLHWVFRDSLIVFDLSNEEFKFFKLSSSKFSIVGVLRDGRLYQILQSSLRTYVFRIMLNYKCCTEISIELPSEVPYWYFMKPIIYVKRPREFVIMHQYGELVFCDVEKKSESFLCTEVSNVNDCISGEVFSYIQTLELY